MTLGNEAQARIALISVSDKTGIVSFAKTLNQQGFSILSTGGTARELKNAGLPVTGVSDHTGFPEIMDGRVKTLHPKIHGGILGRDIDQQVMSEQQIAPIELVIVNLYPFEAATADPDCSLENAIENIDIGGPAMVRAAAKNNARVAVLTDPADYDSIAAELERDGKVSASTRFAMAAKAYAHTARYDSLVAAYLARRTSDAADDGLPNIHTPRFSRRQELQAGHP